MGLFSNLIGKFKSKNTKFNEMEQDYNLQRKLEAKQLSANERELSSYQHENRERMITRALEAERKRRLNEWWTGHQILREPNQFKNNRNIFKNQKRLFAR